MSIKSIVAFVFLIVFISVNSIFDCVRAQDAAPNLDECEKISNLRDLKLQNLDEVWKVEHTCNIKGLSKSEYAQYDKAVNEIVKSRILKDRVTDEKQIQEYYSSEKKISDIFRYSTTSQSTYEIAINRNETQTFITGIQIDPYSKMSRQISEIYGDKWRFFYNGSTSTLDEKTVASLHPTIYGTKNLAVYSMVGNYNGFALMPYDLCLMAGLNPLKLLGGEWKSNSSKGFQLEKNYTYSPTGAFDRITISLDARHEYVPKSIISVGHNIIYHVTHLRKYRGMWIADEFVRTWEAGQKTDIQKFTLKSIVDHVGEKQDISKLLVKYNGEVIDTRLAGVDLEFSDLLKVVTDESQLVNYRWRGTIPSIEDLKGLKNSSDFVNPKTSSVARTIIFIPGVLLIATGVFLKLRKSRKEKESATPTPKSK